MSHTIVLVHGAFAESSSWDGVIDPLEADGHRVVAAPNPLRSLAADAASVSDLVRTIDGPVVLVAHSYGGAVISNVDPDAGEIAGSSTATGSPRRPARPASGSRPCTRAACSASRRCDRCRGATGRPTSRRSRQLPDVFCQDVPAAQAALMAVTQRPATQEALTEPSGDSPLWKDVPSWFLIGEEDRIIPPELQRFMAHRAGSRRTS